MRATDIKSCYIGPEISPEQFIAEHFFIYLAKGKIHGYDGHRHYSLNQGTYCLVRKNHLARYHKERVDGAFEKVVIILDEAFLKQQAFTIPQHTAANNSYPAFISLKEDERMHHYIASLIPYYKPSGTMDNSIFQTKREELLQLLLQMEPALASVLFDFGQPGKLDLEAFMNRNYKFNVSLERFAFLTGRSLSAFKRDFNAIFNSSPSKWLLKRRLAEAYFLLDKKQKSPSEIFMDIGFENLSHFSFAFKKEYGLAPSQLQQKG